MGFGGLDTHLGEGEVDGRTNDGTAGRGLEQVCRLGLLAELKLVEPDRTQQLGIVVSLRIWFQQRPGFAFDLVIFVRQEGIISSERFHLHSLPVAQDPGDLGVRREPQFGNRRAGIGSHAAL